MAVGNVLFWIEILGNWRFAVALGGGDLDEK